MARSYRLLIFDWDGTVIDSISAIVGCTREALEACGVDGVPDERIRGAIGLGLRETIDRFRPGCEDELYHRILHEYRTRWIEDWSHRPEIFPGLPEALERFRSDDYLLAVATAKSRRGLRRDWERTGLGKFFHGSRTLDESPSKPNPEMLRSLLDEFGIRAPDALMVGDSVHDLEMAANAGVDSIGVTSGAAPAEDLTAHAPVEILETAAGLPDWLGGVAATPAVGATTSD